MMHLSVHILCASRDQVAEDAEFPRLLVTTFQDTFSDLDPGIMHLSALSSSNVFHAPRLAELVQAATLILSGQCFSYVGTICVHSFAACTLHL
jgi:hypothetical protein